jgi:hypothetical protein
MRISQQECKIHLSPTTNIFLYFLYNYHVRCYKFKLYNLIETYTNILLYTKNIFLPWAIFEKGETWTQQCPSRERHVTVQDKRYGKDIEKKFRHSPTQTTKISISPALNSTVHSKSSIYSQFSQLIRFYTSKPITHKPNSAHITPVCAATYVPHPRTIYI